MTISQTGRGVGLLKQNALIALVFLVPASSIGTAAALLWLPDMAAGRVTVLGSKPWIILVPMIWLKLVDHEPLSWSPPRHGGFGMAAALGFAIAAVIVLAFVLLWHLGAINPAIV